MLKQSKNILRGGLHLFFEHDSIRATQKFFKSIPANQIKQVRQKLYHYFNLYSSADNHRLHSGARPKKFQGVAGVYALRISDGERIIFSVEKMESNGKFIVLREYSKHDTQERYAREHKIDDVLSMPVFQELSSNEEILSENISEDIERIDSYPPLEFEKEKLIIITDELLSEYFKTDNQDYIWFPSAEQEKAINANAFPQFITGSAGTGKTTVILHKLFMFSQRNNKILYVTVSKALKDEVKRLFNKFKPEQVEAEVSFATLSDLFSPVLNNQLIVTQEMFSEKFSEVCKKSNLDTYTVWCEIEGVLKAHLGEEMKFKEQLLTTDTKTLSFDNYIQTKDKYSFFSTEKAGIEERKKVYEITKSYDEWITDNDTIVDANQLAAAILEKHDNLKYDLIIIDEVQDFTELQLYVLISLVNSKENVIFSGDINQNIRPTVFDFSRLYNIYFELNMPNIKNNTYRLTKNHRSCREIVSLLNKALLKQRELIGAQEIFLEEEGFRDGSKPVALVSDENVVNDILQAIFDKHYAIVIVSSEEECSEMCQLCPEAKGRIFTVQEAKGLEYDVVIAINITSDYEIEWEAIGKKEAKHSIAHRQIFGYIYVAASRAKNYLTILEKKIPNTFLKLIDGTYRKLEDLNLEVVGLDKSSTSNDFIREAEILEKYGLHEKAEQAKSMAEQIKKRDEDKIREKGEILSIDEKDEELSKEWRFELGKYLVAVEKNGYWGIEDRQGNIIRDYIYEKDSIEFIKLSNEKRSVIKLPDKKGVEYITMKGESYTPQKLKKERKKLKRSLGIAIIAVVVTSCIVTPKIYNRISKTDPEVIPANDVPGLDDPVYPKISDYVSGKIIKVIVTEAGNGVINENGELWMWGDRNFADGIFHMEHVKDVEGNGMLAIINQNDELMNWDRFHEGVVETSNMVQLMNDVESVSLANGYGMAIKKDHTLWEWGNREDNNWFVDENGAMLTEQTKIMDNVKKIICTDSVPFAIKEDNSLWTWGKIRRDKEQEKINIPTKIMEDVENVAMADENNVFILKTDGSLWDLRTTQLDDNDNTGYRYSILINEAPYQILDGVKQITIGEYYLYALLENGDVLSWDLWGYYGVEERPNENNVVEKLQMDAVQISGNDHTCLILLKSDGSVWARGSNNRGRLGDGTDINSDELVKIY